MLSFLKREIQEMLSTPSKPFERSPKGMNEFDKKEMAKTRTIAENAIVKW